MYSSTEFNAEHKLVLPTVPVNLKSTTYYQRLQENSLYVSCSTVHRVYLHHFVLCYSFSFSYSPLVILIVLYYSMIGQFHYYHCRRACASMLLFIFEFSYSGEAEIKRIPALPSVHHKRLHVHPIHVHIIP